MKQLYFLILVLGFSLPIMAMENGKIETNGVHGTFAELPEIKIEMSKQRVMPVGELMKSLGYTSTDLCFDQVTADLTAMSIPSYNTLCDALTTPNKEVKKIVLLSMSKQKSFLHNVLSKRNFYYYLLVGENVVLATVLAILALAYVSSNA